MTEAMDWSPLLELPKLAYLNQHGECGVDTDHWDVLADLPALRVLCDPVAITDDRPHEHVEQLVVNCTNEDMSPGLSDWPRLTSIKWVGACHTEFILCFPADLHHLVLELDYSIELSYLERLTHLESLRVRCHVEGYGLVDDEGSNEPENYSFLSSLTALERLELENEPFDDLQVLEPMQKLRHLCVAGTLVAHVEPLLALPSLEYVDLKNTPAMDDVRAILRRHPRLRRLRHPNGYDLLAPFSVDDLAPPMRLPGVCSTPFEWLE